MITIETGVLLQAQKENELTLKQIADRAAIDWRTVDSVLAGRCRNLDKFAAVAEVLGVSAIKVEFELPPKIGQELAAAE